MVCGKCVQRHSLCVGELQYAMYSTASRVRGVISLITVVPVIGVIRSLHSLGMFVHGHFGSTKCDSVPGGPSPQCHIGGLVVSMAQWPDIIGSLCQLLRPSGYTLCVGFTTPACVVFVQQRTGIFRGQRQHIGLPITWDTIARFTRGHGPPGHLV